jgi:pimeloyl-ACP methyl ester carboxylesterase
MGRRSRRTPERLFVRTRDGWSLATYRYRPSRPSFPTGPILLVHGLGANRLNLDGPEPRISLAKYLFERGHEVWVVELRGSGASRAPGWPLRRRAAYDFDDYVHRDVPALMRRVLDESGAEALHWVGHSMGGMLAYAALEHFDQHLFRSVVTVASPAFTGVKHPLVDRLYSLRFLLKVMPWLPYRALGGLASHFPALLARTAGTFAANPVHMDPAHVRVLAAHALHDLPAPLMEQFAEWYQGRYGFSRTDGLKNYYHHLDRITAPILLIAGGGDVLTPVEDLRGVFAAIRSTDKALLVAGRAEGFSLDYGHIDLILGTRARQEIYPRISDWIEAHA